VRDDETLRGPPFGLRSCRSSVIGLALPRVEEEVGAGDGRRRCFVCGVGSGVAPRLSGVLRFFIKIFTKS
jgi:hypothetical protein